MNDNVYIGLCHHCQGEIGENDSYVQRGSLEGNEIEQFHVKCFWVVKPGGWDGLIRWRDNET